MLRLPRIHCLPTGPLTKSDLIRNSEFCKINRIEYRRAQERDPDDISKAPLYESSTKIKRCLMRDYSRPVTVRIRSRGQVTIPRELREQMDLSPDTTLRMIRIGRTLVISPTPSKRAALARQVEASMKASAITLDDLLEELRSQRERYFDESYAEDKWEET